MIDFPTPIETALSYIRIYNSHDPVALRKLYRDDFLVENPLWSGTRTVDEVVTTIQHVWATLPDARMELKNIIADGNVVALEFVFAWTDDSLEAKAGNGGRPVSQGVPVVDVFHVREGKLAALRAYMDHGPVAEALAARARRS
ncbi:MAG: nuclear transport factor 2 family protein [Betaproteobacteria bacterium]|nr:nuclear transport factor 2 family protein [Betaproteobacteria bacterium]